MTSRLSRRIKQVMTRSGMNMRELADASGVPYGWVRQIAAGGIARPDAVRLSKLAAALGIPPSELLALSDQLGSVESQDAASAPTTPDLATAIRDLTVEIGEWRRERAVVAELATRVADLEQLLATMAGRSLPAEEREDQPARRARPETTGSGR